MEKMIRDLLSRPDTPLPHQVRKNDSVKTGHGATKADIWGRRGLSSRGKRGLSVLLVLSVLGCAGSLVAAEESGPAGPQVIVHTEQVEGRLSSDSITNTSVESVFGQVTGQFSDPAFQWVRATNALSYVRCYNWLGDGVPKNRPEWFSGCRVARQSGGQVVYQWDGLERVIDNLIASGVKPFIVCGGVPDALAAGPIRRNEGGQAVNRPKDYAQYGDMLKQMFQRLEKTYGPEEVRTWYFEAWSQPDHEGSWEGGRPAPFREDTTAQMVEPFTRLYDQIVAAADSVDPKIRVGGPGLAGDLSFFRRFLAHCAGGANTAVAGKTGARLDFISWQRYGTVPDIVKWNSELRGIVETEFPQLKGAQFVLSECGTGPIEGARASTCYEAARMAALLDANARSARPMDMMFRTGDLIDDHFDGFRPLITRIGQNTVPLPAFRLFWLLSKMSEDRLKTEPAAGVGVLATRSPAKSMRSNAIQALVYRYDPSQLTSDGAAVPVKVRFKGLPSNLLRLPMRVYRIDPEHNAVYEPWEAAGKPRPAEKSIEEKLKDLEQGGAKPTEAELKLLALGRQLAGEDRGKGPNGEPLGPFSPDEQNLNAFVNSGEIVTELKLPPNSVALVTLGAEPSYEVELSKRGKLLTKAEDDFNAAANERQIGQAQKAISMFQKVREKYPDTAWAQAAQYALVAIYELDLRQPVQAEAARKELLNYPLDDVTRLRLLERLRVDAGRTSDQARIQELTARIAELEDSMAAMRRWDLRRYLGQ